MQVRTLCFFSSCGRERPNARKINSIIKRRSAAFVRGEWDDLLHEYSRNNPPGRAQQGTTTGDDSEERDLRRILKIATKGLLAKAARRLLEPGTMTVDQDTITALRYKHPARSAAIDPQEWSPRGLDSVDKIELSWAIVPRDM